MSRSAARRDGMRLARPSSSECPKLGHSEQLTERCVGKDPDNSQ